MSVASIDILVSVLSDLGLSDIEIAVYRTLLIFGPRPAATIAKHNNLNRAYSYNILKGLLTKGYIQESIKGSVKLFSNVPLSEILQQLENKENRLSKQRAKFAQAIPLINELNKTGATNISNSSSGVRVLHGEKGLSQLYSEASNYNKDQVRAFIQSESPRKSKAIPPNSKLKSIKDKVPCLSLVAGNRLNTKRKKHDTATKWLADLSLLAEILVFGPNVALIPQTEERAVVLESHSIAESLRSIHQKMWDLLPED